MSSPFPDPDRPAGPELTASGKGAGAGDPGSESLERREPGERRESDEKEGGLFAEVLQETTHAFVSQEPLTAAEKRAFEEVAMRLRGKPLPLETIASELVYAVLKNHLSALPDFDALGRALAERVARTMINDPAAKLRLESIWNHLQEGLP